MQKSSLVREKNETDDPKSQQEPPLDWGGRSELILFYITAKITEDINSLYFTPLES